MECTVTTAHMLTLLGLSQWTVGCKHKTLAIIGVDVSTHDVLVSLLLENKTVLWRLSRGRVSCSDSEEVG